MENSAVSNNVLTRLLSTTPPRQFVFRRPPGYAMLKAIAIAHKVCLVSLVSSFETVYVYLTHPGSAETQPLGEDVISCPALAEYSLRSLVFGKPDNTTIDFESVGQVISTDGRERDLLGWMAAYSLVRQSELRFEHPFEVHRIAKNLWRTTMDRVLAQLGKFLLSPLARRLQQLGFSDKRVILIPAVLLSQIPLHAAPISLSEESGMRFSTSERFSDLFEVSYAPNPEAAVQSLNRATARLDWECPILVAVSNPDGSLTYADDEVDKIAELFCDPKCIARGNQAHREWVLENTEKGDCVVFSTHGSFDVGNPGKSFLQLANPERHRIGSLHLSEQQPEGTSQLTAHCERVLLEDIWKGVLKLKQCCIVSANACETGQVDPGEASEVHLGFPAAFLGAGASAVIASFWAVDDLSTSLLMEGTFQRIVNGTSPAKALQESSRAVRALPKDQVLKLLDERIDACRVGEESSTDEDDKDQWARRKAALKDRRSEIARSSEEFPFDHPEWWAAFAVHGA